MASLFFRNFIFTILHPGIVAGLIPYWILRRAEVAFPGAWGLLQFSGAAVFIAGLALMLKCIAQFAIEGRGTLSPADPTKQLVIKGMYRYSRNPMYVGVMLILTGEAIFFQLADLWAYAFCIFLLFNVFIFFVEEPRLHRDFGQDYRDYCAKVRRWI